MKRLMIVFVLAAVGMVLVFRFAGWYAHNSALPRFCEDPRATVGYVGKILVRDKPVGEDARRPYIIAAKLIFLVPQQDGETQGAYLLRLQDKISQTCGQPY